MTQKKRPDKEDEEGEGKRFILWLTDEDRSKLERLSETKYGRVPMASVIRELIREAPEPTKEARR
jgi:hypothetical protein